MLVGTPAYLAPERAEGGPATPASDLYSLGVVGYECLTGAPPFRGMLVEVAAAHRLRALPALPSAVPAGVAGLVAELTTKDPAARPASAGEVARRASQLQDTLAAGAATVLAQRKPDGLAAAAWAGAQPATLVGAPAMSATPGPRCAPVGTGGVARHWPLPWSWPAWPAGCWWAPWPPRRRSGRRPHPTPPHERRAPRPPGPSR